MPRRAIRLNVKPPEPETAARYLRFWRQADLHFHPERHPRITSEALFENGRPLDLEVGCGTGEFLCSLAAQEPEINFVGIDVYPKALYRAVEQAAAQGLDNILFIRAPVQFVYPLLEPDSIRTIYIHYPDPHLRARRQHKIFNQTFLDAVHLALEPGGHLSVITDHELLFFEEILPLVEADARFEKHHEERYLIGYDPGTKSRYQKMWEKHDVEPLRILVAKRA
jgi:tRNA (guanine-N7-)-methyltransferase